MKPYVRFDPRYWEDGESQPTAIRGMPGWMTPHGARLRAPARPRVKHAFGKGWEAVSRYLPEEGVTVRVKCRNRGLGDAELVMLERGYCWKNARGVIESRQVTHWRYRAKVKRGK